MNMLMLLAQNSVDFSYSTSGDMSSAGGMGLGGTIIWLIIVVGMVASMWKVFVKAGQPGWAALVPLYNFYIMLKIVGKPGWWMWLMLVPLANLVVAIILTMELAKVFGKGTGFGILLLLVPFVGYPMLGFGKAVYKKPVVA
jgi:hypothetical protein